MNSEILLGKLLGKIQERERQEEIDRTNNLAVAQALSNIIPAALSTLVSVMQHSDEIATSSRLADRLDRLAERVEEHIVLLREIKTNDRILKFKGGGEKSE